MQAKNKQREISIVTFAGGGGSSVGVAQALGRPVDFALNHDADALAMHAANHPTTVHLKEDVFNLDVNACLKGRPFGTLWASPTCSHFSVAKGGALLDRGIRGLADSVVTMARQAPPRLIYLENVKEFRSWCDLDANGRPIKEQSGHEFDRWVRDLQALGYVVDWRVLNAADYGAPTSRERLFLVARRDGRPICWPSPTHSKNGQGGLLPWLPASSIIDWSVPCRSIFGRKKDLADNTLRRIARGLERYVINDPNPFIVSIDNTGKGSVGGVRSGGSPLSTITTKARHALVAPLISKMYGTSTGSRMSDPVATITSGGGHHGLVVPFIAKNYTGVIGHDVRATLGTVTTRDHHSLVEARLGEAQPAHVAAWLTKFYGTANGASMKDPLDTVTCKGRFGLTTARIALDQIVDIGFRMLTPRELARATGFDDDYVLAGTQESQTARIGNAVVPQVARALVAANN